MGRYTLPIRARPTFPKGVGDVIISALAGFGINSETSKFEDYKACSVQGNFTTYFKAYQCGKDHITNTFRKIHI